MSLLELVLILASFLTALVAGFVFAFASVVMPGIGKLSDGHFIRAFQVIDGVIQAGQPVFRMVWLGSAVFLILATVLGALQLGGGERAIIIAAALAYMLGVVLPTFKINVPLNNMLQSVDVETSNGEELAAARHAFEQRWVRWNTIRTGIACMVSVALIIVLQQT